ncbi:TetR/AcrR family transcriptional regulator [Lacticaseibacillus thailandensis]|uniref:TetR family transcriptional regulator n=1 Tax=Lacticaseibacillus thailandensis DSM 22698 = JCM 13996 TaxID=1423810 RepID=A0A0R2CHQ8_9LACO|nr:TetR/AcrR family transcriptional regulator [Lacticaseibacillus thailandensis]KRM87203.1 TetR family transcriptional regulator [Lacticaseibacillus thailandensis DSM 22698 = JCM 13996]
MVLSTFDHIPAAKQARVRAALMDEFTHHPLAEAQVARIVQSAGIARGAFYKYFADLTDAYQYVFADVMRVIHSGVPRQVTSHNGADYVAAVRHFVEAVDTHGYRAFITMYYRHNESVVGVRPTRILEGDDGPRRWAVAVLCHQTVRDVLLDPDQAEARLTQLQQALGD